MDFLSLLYMFAGFVFSIACLPQLRALLRDETGAASISLTSWMMFTVCNGITLSYAIIHTHDSLFVLCSSLCTVANSAVLLMACVRRFQFCYQRVRILTPPE